MNDLPKAKQKPYEGVDEFVTRWRNLSLQCLEKQTKKLAIQICSNNLLPKIATFVSTIEPQSFYTLISIACSFVKTDEPS